MSRDLSQEGDGQCAGRVHHSSLPYRVSSYGDFLRQLEMLACPMTGHYHFHEANIVGPPLTCTDPNAPPGSADQCACAPSNMQPINAQQGCNAPPRQSFPAGPSCPPPSAVPPEPVVGPSCAPESGYNSPDNVQPAPVPFQPPPMASAQNSQNFSRDSLEESFSACAPLNEQSPFGTIPLCQMGRQGCPASENMMDPNFSIHGLENLFEPPRDEFVPILPQPIPENQFVLEEDPFDMDLSFSSFAPRFHSSRIDGMESTEGSPCDLPLSVTPNFSNLNPTFNGPLAGGTRATYHGQSGRGMVSNHVPRNATYQGSPNVGMDACYAPDGGMNANYNGAPDGGMNAAPNGGMNGNYNAVPNGGINGTYNVPQNGGMNGGCNAPQNGGMNLSYHGAPDGGINASYHGAPDGGMNASYQGAQDGGMNTSYQGAPDGGMNCAYNAAPDGGINSSFQGPPDSGMNGGYNAGPDGGMNASYNGFPNAEMGGCYAAADGGMNESYHGAPDGGMNGSFRAIPSNVRSSPRDDGGGEEPLSPFNPPAASTRVCPPSYGASIFAYMSPDREMGRGSGPALGARRRSSGSKDGNGRLLNKSMPRTEGYRSLDFPIQTSGTDFEWPCAMLNGMTVKEIPLKNKSYTDSEYIMMRIFGNDFRYIVSGFTKTDSIVMDIPPREIETLRVAFEPRTIGVSRTQMLIVRGSDKSYRVINFKGTCKAVCPPGQNN